MALRVSGKNIDVGEALRTRLSDRVSEVIGKYFDGGWSGHVTVSRDGSGYRSECLLHLDSGVNLQAQGNAHDANASADAALDKVEKRLRRYKQKLKDRHGHGNGNGAVDAQAYVLEAPEVESEEEFVGWSPTVVAEQVTKLRQLTVSDAVLELEITGAPVVVFRHAGHGRMSVVYRRPDGHVGWIDPAAFSEEKH